MEAGCRSRPIPTPLRPSSARLQARDWRAWCVIALAAIVAALSAAPRLGQPVSWDASHVYLPMAHALLDQGLAFFARPESVKMPPLAYAWPALLGANEHVARWVNLALFPLVVVLAACAAGVHSRRAAIAAAFLAACSPLLRLWIADVVTEPPFLALTAAWLFGVSRISTGGGRGWIAFTAAAFALASLTRPAASLFAPVACAGFALLARLARSPQDHSIDRRLAWAHGLATLGWLAWLAHNAWRFGFPAIASGAGTALWLGLNPVTQGFDPIYFGLDYDDGSIARDMDHLGIAGDRLLHAAAMLQLHDLSWRDLAGLFARKAAAFVFVTPYEAPGASPAWMGAFRIALVVLSAVAVVRRPRLRLVQATAAFALYMLAVHLPLLYTLRYSVGALDLPLTLLAGIGAAECAALSVGSVAAFAFAIGVALRLPAMAMPAHAVPHTEHALLETLWQRDVAQLEVRTENAKRTGPRTFLLQPGAALELDVRDGAFHPWYATLASVELAISPTARGRPCTDMYVNFRGLDEPAFDSGKAVRVALDADGAGHDYRVGGNHPLRLVREGVLRLAFDCPVAAWLEIGTIRVSASSRGLVYYERIPARLKEH